MMQQTTGHVQAMGSRELISGILYYHCAAPWTPYSKSLSFNKENIQEKQLYYSLSSPR